MMHLASDISSFVSLDCIALTVPSDFFDHVTDPSLLYEEHNSSLLTGETIWHILIAGFVAHLVDWGPAVTQTNLCASI